MALGFSIVIVAVGAILRYAYAPSTPSHGFNIATIGGILIIAGIVGVVLSMVGWIASARRHQRSTATTESNGRIVRRDDVDSTTTPF